MHISTFEEPHVSGPCQELSLLSRLRRARVFVALAFSVGMAAAFAWAIAVPDTQPCDGRRFDHFQIICVIFCWLVIKWLLNVCVARSDGFHSWAFCKSASAQKVSMLVLTHKKFADVFNYDQD